MHNDKNGVVFGDVRSHVHAGPASPDATLGAPGAVREGRLKSRDELAREVEVLGKRTATLSAAVLHLGSSLDLATVLQETADSARTLTNARYSLAGGGVGLVMTVPYYSGVPSRASCLLTTSFPTARLSCSRTSLHAL